MSIFEHQEILLEVHDDAGILLDLHEMMDFPVIFRWFSLYALNSYEAFVSLSNACYNVVDVRCYFNHDGLVKMNKQFNAWVVVIDLTLLMHTFLVLSKALPYPFPLP